MKSLDELRQIRDKAIKNLTLRQHEHENSIKVLVGMSTCGIAVGARETLNAMLEEVKRRELNNVVVTQVGCIGYCYAEPLVQVNFPNKEPILYGKVTKEKTREIIEKHILQGQIVEELVLPVTHQ